MMVVILNLILMEELLEFSSVGYATRELFPVRFSISLFLRY